jgi:hypothetical protein
MIALICIDNLTDASCSEVINTTIYRDAQRRQRDLERIAMSKGEDGTQRYTNFQLVVMPGLRPVGTQRVILLNGNVRLVRWFWFRHIPMPLQRKKDEAVPICKVLKKVVKRA